ncbi:MAG: hypothetical protein CMN76_20170 [Spirochaetaceae bacterium]|nr:hypothetical protein [Spirochaetaceae bacterium]|tara:strand:+ start:9628 stop:10863 length:1236 start_codon:yes stop_codon:yes gene_type:complete
MHQPSRNPCLSKSQQTRFLELCQEAGFDLYGFTLASISQEDRENLDRFARENASNDLHWFNQHVHLRTHPSDILPGAISVLMLGAIYRHPEMDEALANSRAKVSRYAAGKDYHLVLRKKAARLADRFFELHRKELPGLRYRVTTDSAPVPEKILARNAGLGWQGKNTNLIHPEMGSYFFLTGVFLNADLEGFAEDLLRHPSTFPSHSNSQGLPDLRSASPENFGDPRKSSGDRYAANSNGGETARSAEQEGLFGSEVPEIPTDSESGAQYAEPSLFRAPNVDRCGSCRQCLDACPTGALEPYRIEASKCISYWTIEAKSAMPETVAANIQSWIFGCDICQEVCPYNRGAKGRRQVTKEESFEPRSFLMQWMASPTDPGESNTWSKLSVSSPLKRPGQDRFRESWKVIDARS